jgi:histone H3/H4
MAGMPKTFIEAALRAAGAKRVSPQATEALRKATEAYAMAMAEAAVQVAAHGKRQTVTGEDVNLVVKMASG